MNQIKNETLNRAIKVAQKSLVVRGKTGAVLFHNSGQIITSACNVNMYGKQDKDVFTIHAEAALMAKAMKLKAIQRFGLPNLNVLVVRWKPSLGGRGNAKPCVPCQYLLGEAGLTKVYFSDENGEIQKL